MEPQCLIGRAMCADDHRGRYVGGLEATGPLRNHLAITGEYHCLGRVRRDVNGDLPTTVVLKYLGDELSRHGHHPSVRT